MKTTILILSFISFAHASALKQMDQRLKVYAESKVICESGNESLSDEGLFIDVSCDFKCRNDVPRVERVKGTFLPKKLGLFPGNGSSDQSIMWSALGVSLKIWSQNICLEKAAIGCKNAQNIESYGMKELQSGAWKINKFPGCKEKSILVSPFDNRAGSVRVPNISAAISMPETSKTIDFENSGLKFSLQSGKSMPECKNKIKAKLCFGDCVDLSTSDKEISETLGTPDPLGSDDMEICGDELATKLQDLKLSISVRREICEAYFWQSFMKMDNTYKSCAAIRGETTCESF